MKYPGFRPSMAFALTLLAVLAALAFLASCASAPTEPAPAILQDTTVWDGKIQITDRQVFTPGALQWQWYREIVDCYGKFDGADESQLTAMWEGVTWYTASHMVLHDVRFGMREYVGLYFAGPPERIYLLDTLTEHEGLVKHELMHMLKENNGESWADNHLHQGDAWERCDLL